MKTPKPRIHSMDVPDAPLTQYQNLTMRCGVILRNAELNSCVVEGVPQISQYGECRHCTAIPPLRLERKTWFYKFVEAQESLDAGQENAA